MPSRPAKTLAEKPVTSPGADLFATLVEALSHDDPAVRMGAVREFSKRQEKRGVAVLVEALTDESAAVRKEAAKALDELGWTPPDLSAKAQRLVAMQEFQAVAVLGPEAADALKVALVDQEEVHRVGAVEALCHIGGERTEKFLLERLADPSAHVRAIAVQGLAKMGVTKATEPILKLARDESWEVRAVVLDALETFRTPACWETAVIFLKDPAPDLRMRATEVLGHTGDPKMITSLVAALGDEDGAVRMAAEINLQKLDGNWQNSDYVKGTPSSLLAAHQHQDETVPTKASEAPAQSGAAHAMSVRVEAAMNTPSQSAVSILAQSLVAANSDLRQAAAEALGRQGDVAAIQHLVGALCDEDQYVREAALNALNLLNWKPVNDFEVVLKAVILQRWETVAAFETIGFEPTALALTCDDPEVCRAAITTLGQIGDKRAMEPVSQMLFHPQKAVRTAAAQTLRTLGWLPPEARLSVLQAIELEDWFTVAQHGAAAVEPVIAAIKENYNQTEFCTAATDALSSITDGQAAKVLLNFCRDGQVAEGVIRALMSLVEKNAGEIELEALRTMGGLSNIFQFRYTFDPRYGTLVRSGLQEVDSARLKKLALQEMARRGEV